MDDFVRDCWLYLRKSNGKAGIERQRRDSRAHADRLRWRILGEFIDEDSTAYAPPGAPPPVRDDYSRMLARLQADTPPVPVGVLAWHIDRLLRNTFDVEEFIVVGINGRHPIETVRSGSYEVWTPKGRQRIRHDVADATYEVDHLIDRGASERGDRARFGKWSGGPVPMGWRRIRLEDDTPILVVHPEEQAAIEWAYLQILANGETTLPFIIREWIRRGLKPARADEWTANTVKQILLRPRNAGFAVLNRQVVETDREDGKAEWEPLIDEATYLAVAHILTDPERKPGDGPPNRWFGSRLYVCGGFPAGRNNRCLSTMKIGYRGNSGPGYRCKVSGPGHVTRGAYLLDAFVQEVLVNRLSRPDVRRWLGKVEAPDVRPIRAKIAAKQAELREWRAQLDDPDAEMDPISYGRREKTLVKAIQELRVELSVVAAANSPLIPEILDVADFAAYWQLKEGDLDWQRACLDLFATVTILPVTPGRVRGEPVSARIFKPEGVRFEWKPLMGRAAPA